MNEEKLLRRIKKLENEVSDLSGMTKEIKATLDRFVGSAKMTPALSRNVMGVTRVSNANPWTVQSTKRIMETRRGRKDFIQSAREETYKKTLRALQSEKKWLSASEIRKKTGRKRNTESTYLSRLYRAGLIEQKVEGNKTLYTISDHQKLERIFGKI